MDIDYMLRNTMKITKYLIIGAGITITPTVYYVYNKFETIMVTSTELKVNQINK